MAKEPTPPNPEIINLDAAGACGQAFSNVYDKELEIENPDTRSYLKTIGGNKEWVHIQSPLDSAIYFDIKRPKADISDSPVAFWVSRIHLGNPYVGYGPPLVVPSLDTAYFYLEGHDITAAVRLNPDEQERLITEIAFGLPMLMSWRNESSQWD